MDLLKLFRWQDEKRSREIEESVRQSEGFTPTYEEGGILGGDGKSLRCTYCGGTDFYEGPSGGMSTNVLCANEKCRHWFNWTQLLSQLDDLKKVEPTKEEKEVEQAERKTKTDEELTARINEGAAIYRDGSAAAMRLAQRSKGWTNPRLEHLDQFAGFMDAMANDIKAIKEIAGQTAVVLDPGIPHYEMGSDKPIGHIYPAEVTSDFDRGWDAAISAVIELSKKWMYHIDREEPPYHLSIIGEDERRELESLKKGKKDGVPSG
jgi:hypothetical protein